MSNDGYLMTPEGMEIALLRSKLSGNVTTQQALCEYMDDWIAAVLTGQEARSSAVARWRLPARSARMCARI